MEFSKIKFAARGRAGRTPVQARPPKKKKKSLCSAAASRCETEGGEELGGGIGATLQQNGSLIALFS